MHRIIQGDQKVFLQLMITMQKAGAQRLFDHPVFREFILMPLVYLIRCVTGLLC